MLRNSAWLALALVPLAAGGAAAQGPAIEHKQIKCIVAGKHPRMDACFLPPDVGQSRVYFRVQGTPSWYYVDMKAAAAVPPAGPCHQGVLPKPQKKLVGQHIEYYVEASDKSFNPARTAEFVPLVVADAGECEPDVVAPISPTGPPGLFPGTPAALAGGGGLSTAAVVGGLAGVGAAAGTAAVVTGDDDETFPLQVARAGTGSGTVTSVPAGIDCGGTCTATFTGGTQVSLTATADGSSTFAGWEGACSGTGVCTVTMDAARSVTARFTGRFTLSVARAGNGAGTVTSAPAGINCGAACTAAYDGGTTVVLTAAPAGGSTFTGWSGACSGTGTCTVVMDAARSVTATFTVPGVRLTVVKAGTGSGTVTSDPPGIDCGPFCTSGFDLNTRVTLRAAPASGSLFLGWTGGGCGGSGECTVTMDSAKAVTATFEGQLRLSVSVGGTGTGTVTSRPGGINCGVGNTGACGASYDFQTTVDLTATAGAGTVFVGWGGECAGTVGTTCRVIMDDARSVTATFSGRKRLDVVKAGSGTGTVTSSPAGIACGTTCSAEFDGGTAVTLTATPDRSMIFTGWSGGGCSGVAPCTVVLNNDVTVTATFQPATVQLQATADGPGTVSDNQGQITNCDATCTGTYPFGTTVGLTATDVGDGAGFVGWSGACSGTGACSLLMDRNRAVTATFGWPLSVTLTGSGSGTVTSAPPGISCGSDCDELYREGTPVALTAAASGGSSFIGWSGDCTGTGTCNVTVNNVTSVTAQFELARTVTVTATTCTNPSFCDGAVRSSSTPPQPGEPLINCVAVPGGPPTVCSATYPNGTSLTLTISAVNTFVTWGGACAGQFGDQCVLPIDGNKSITAAFDALGAARRPGPGAEPVAVGSSLSWISVLEAPGAEGHVVFNGQQAGFAGTGVARLSAAARAGENRVEARIQKAQGQPGTWRFELQSKDTLEPGSLRVVQGEPVMVLPEAIVFRVRGTVGEQVAFTYRVKTP